MKYIKDDRLGKNISKIGLGAARFGTNLSEKEAFQLLDIFSSCGGTLIDTARSYSPWKPDSRGNSEKCIGKWMEINNKRGKMVLVTKGGIRGEHGEIIDASKTNLINELDESLEALRTNYIDIYLLHKDDTERTVEEIIETMQFIKEKAKATRIGIANMEYNRFRKAVLYAKNNHLEVPSVLQTWWSLAEYKKEMWNDTTTTHMDSSMYHFLKENNMICMAYTSQCKGYFQKMVLKEEKAIDSFLKMRIETKRNIKKAEYIKQYCCANDIHPTAFVNGYITSNQLEGVALVSCSTEKQLLNVMENSNYILPQKLIEEIDCI